MRAVVYSEYGSPDVLRLEERKRPLPEAHEVLVQVRAASINDWDWALMRGETTNRLLNGLTRPRKIHIPGVTLPGMLPP